MSQPAGTIDSPRQPSPTDHRLGRYRLAYELASGGMATLFMACTEGAGGFHKVVALKRIHPHLARRESYVAMFMDEARLASRLTHPNVCGVIDFGQEGDTYFLVMELLLGVPLNRLLATLSHAAQQPAGRPSPARWAAVASRLAADAAEGLHSAHELRDARGQLSNVVHRDISPHNLFVGFDGALRVLDFGIAKADGRLHRTNTGEIKGKFAYMAPEQIRNDEVDRRADVWALGVVLWEALTFRRLFRRQQEVDTMYAILEGEIAPPSRYAEIPPELDALVLSALERDPEKRLPDARTFGRELMQIWTSGGRRPADGPDVAEMLRELYPGEEARQRNLVELARQQRDSVPKIGLTPGDTGSFSGVHTGTLEDAGGEGRMHAERTRGWMIAAVVAVLALAAGGAVGWSFTSSDGGAGASGVERPEPPPRAADEPSSTPPDSVEEPPEVETPRAVSPSEPEPAVADAPSPRADTAPSSERAVKARRPRSPAPPRGAEEARPAPAPGRVAVVVPGGWANVYGPDGRFLGATPLTAELPAGRHRIELRFNGEPPPVRVTVEVPSAGTVRVSRPPPR